MGIVAALLLAAGAAGFLAWRYLRARLAPSDPSMQDPAPRQDESDRELDRLRGIHERKASCDSAMALADAYLAASAANPERSRVQDALALYRQCLAQSEKPQLLLKLAWTQYLLERFEDAKETLERIANPGSRFPHHHLLYSRVLEALGEWDEAIENYSALIKYYPGEEARVRCGLLLKRLGRFEEARELLDGALTQASKRSKSYRRREARWLQTARGELFIAYGEEWTSEGIAVRGSRR